MKNQVAWTRRGLVFLIAAILLSPTPLVSNYGVLLAWLGAVLVVLGRKPFGKTHSSYVLWSVVIFGLGVVSIIISIVLFSLVLSPALLSANGGGLFSYLYSRFEILLIAELVGGAIIGVAEVLLTYALQQSTGRTLLWTGYIAVLASNLLVYLLVAPLIAPAVSQSISGAFYDPAPLRDLQASLQAFQLVGLAPALIFSVAYYMVWVRIKRGEIPTPNQPIK